MIMTLNRRIISDTAMWSSSPRLRRNSSTRTFTRLYRVNHLIKVYDAPFKTAGESYQTDFVSGDISWRTIWGTRSLFAIFVAESLPKVNAWRNISMPTLTHFPMFVMWRAVIRNLNKGAGSAYIKKINIIIEKGLWIFRKILK